MYPELFLYTLFEGKYDSMCGSRLSITTLVAASALEMPVRILLANTIKLKWIAIAVVVISLLGITSENAGGEMSHLGGALASLLWFIFMKKI